jgi:hypothetical protein
MKEENLQPKENSYGVISSKKSLLKYTILSVIFALVTLTLVILPAEYNLDPTGLGEKIGLTVFNPEKSEAETAVSESSMADSSMAESSETGKTPVTEYKSPNVVNSPETIKVTVPAGRGVEYKFYMQQYQKMTYQWKTDNSSLYFDLHGEPEGDTTGYFESYAIATLVEMEGSFTAPFSGVHGWYWKNTTNEPVTVELVVSGEYGEHGLK